jgi:hypothetical protein
MIDEVRVLGNQSLATVIYCWQMKFEVTYLLVGLTSSVGSLRGRSVRFFDIACSRNEVRFVLRRLLEKLSVCDLFGFLLNIFGSCLLMVKNVETRPRYSISSKVVVNRGRYRR